MPPVVGPSAAPATTAKAAPAVAVAKENEPKRGGKGAMQPPEPVGAPKAGKGGPSQAKPPAAAPRGSVGAARPKARPPDPVSGRAKFEFKLDFLNTKVFKS